MHRELQTRMNGADRFKYNLVFTKIELTNTDDANFIELLRVNGGVIENKVTRPLYSEIEHTLARRTFDQAGDFVVQQFTHSMREHLDDTTNAGFYTKARGGKKRKICILNLQVRHTSKVMKLTKLVLQM